MKIDPKILNYLQNQIDSLSIIVSSLKATNQQDNIDNNITLTNRIVKIFNSSDCDGLAITDILLELEKTTWKTTSNNKYYVVAATLARRKNIFTKLGKGLYTLNKDNNNEI